MATTLANVAGRAAIACAVGHGAVGDDVVWFVAAQAARGPLRAVDRVVTLAIANKAARVCDEEEGEAPVWVRAARGGRGRGSSGCGAPGCRAATSGRCCAAARGRCCATTNSRCSAAADATATAASRRAALARPLGHK